MLLAYGYGFFDAYTASPTIRPQRLRDELNPRLLTLYAHWKNDYRQGSASAASEPLHHKFDPIAGVRDLSPFDQPTLTPPSHSQPSPATVLRQIERWPFSKTVRLGGVSLSMAFLDRRPSF